MMRRMSYRALNEARWILAVLAVCWLVTMALLPLLSVLLALLILFTLYFFRDPHRVPPADESLAVAPADGLVVDVFETEETEFLHEKVRRVVIFLSVFDVHINRAPMAGEVTHSEAFTGKYLDARNPESSRVNARRTWVIRGPQGTIAVRQITGAIARRICPWRQVGDRLERGERFGMIRFGSRTEVDFPLSAEVLVKVGDRVKGGETAVARMKE
jgi:phosphatidylserine decarboxylase